MLVLFLTLLHPSYTTITMGQSIVIMHLMSHMINWAFNNDLLDVFVAITCWQLKEEKQVWPNRRCCFEPPLPYMVSTSLLASKNLPMGIKIAIQVKYQYMWVPQDERIYLCPRYDQYHINTKVIILGYEISWMAYRPKCIENIYTPNIHILLVLKNGTPPYGYPITIQRRWYQSKHGYDHSNNYWYSFIW